MKKIIGLIGLCLCIALSYGQDQEEWKVSIGEYAPSFTAVGKDNKPTTSEALKGKVVLLNFFATWCPPCRAELPHLQKDIWERWEDRTDFTVLVLAREEGWDKLTPFVQQYGYTFPIFPDLNRAVYGLFATQSIPRNVVLDRDGKIIYQSIGYTPEEFEGMIKVIEKELEK